MSTTVQNRLHSSTVWDRFLAEGKKRLSNHTVMGGLFPLTRCPRIALMRQTLGSSPGEDYWCLSLKDGANQCSLVPTLLVLCPAIRNCIIILCSGALNISNNSGLFRATFRRFAEKKEVSRTTRRKTFQALFKRRDDSAVKKSWGRTCWIRQEITWLAAILSHFFTSRC